MTNIFFDGFALLIGVSENQVPSMALPAVANDIHAMREVLIHPQRCAYPSENVRVLVGTQATRIGILNGLAWLEEKLSAHAGNNITAFIYYSGHGWRDSTPSIPAYYLIPYDFDPQRTRLTALPAQDFATKIAALSPRRQLMVLDCCHAGGIGLKNLENPGGFTPSAIPSSLFMSSQIGLAASKGAVDNLKAGYGRAVLSSSQSNQSSYLNADQTMSVFTYHLIEALTGHAEPKEGARDVLVSDLISHVARRVPESVARMGYLQQPEFQLNGGSFPVALLLGGFGLGKEVQPPNPLEYLPQGTPQIGILDGGAPTFRDKTQLTNYVHGNQVLNLHNDRSVHIQAPMTDSHIITGDKNRLTIQVSSDETPSTDIFLELLHDMRILVLTQANCGVLSSEEAAEVMADIAQITQQAQSENPNSRIILRFLDSSVNFLANNAAVKVSAPQLIELGKKLADWARILFRT